MNRIFVLLIVWLWYGATTVLAQVDLTGIFIIEKMDAQNRPIEKCEASIYKKKGTAYVTLLGNSINHTGMVLVNDGQHFKFQFNEIENGQLVSSLYSGTVSSAGVISGNYIVSIDGVPDEAVSGQFVMKPKAEQVARKDEIGGHFGMVHGLFTFQSGDISGILDENYKYSVGFPMGITVIGKIVSFDLEFVPSITFDTGEANNLEGGHNPEAENDRVSLMIHPGVLYPVKTGLTLGMRMAFELGEAGRYGFTPLVNFGNIIPNGFVEVVLPVRFGSGGDPAITLGIHLGVGF